MLNAILFPILVVGGLGVLFGIILGIAAIKFRVERDPKIDSIREALPGANCGGCGFAGCDALAEAIATGKAPVNGCPVGGAKACAYGCLGDGNCVKACNFDALHVVDGVAVVDKDKCVACGACIKACPKHLIELVPYDNLIRVACNSKDMPKATKDNCAAGCMGCKICERNCPSEAVTVTDFLAHVDYDKCTQCGICTEKCPTKAIAKRA